MKFHTALYLISWNSMEIQSVFLFLFRVQTVLVEMQAVVGVLVHPVDDRWMDMGQW
jgi:hypothetical protein